MLFMFVCSPVHAYGHSDRCWTATVIDFNVYLAALPTGGWHSLPTGCNCKIWESWNRQESNKRHKIMTKVGVGNCNRSSRECNGDTEQTRNWGHGIKSGHGSITGARLHGSLECMVCTWVWEYNYKTTWSTRSWTGYGYMCSSILSFKTHTRQLGADLSQRFGHEIGPS